MQQASSPRLTRLRKESAIAGSDRYSSRDASARPIRKSGRGRGRGATRRGPQAGARAAHPGGTHTQHTYVQAHVSGSLRAGTRRQGHGRHRRTYCQGGDSDWAALRALRAVEARPGSWAKIASTHESGISFGRYRPATTTRNTATQRMLLTCVSSRDSFLCYHGNPTAPLRGRR